MSELIKVSDKLHRQYAQIDSYTAQLILVQEKLAQLEAQVAQAEVKS